MGVANFRLAIISGNFFRKVLLQRHLIWNFVLRDLKTRYVGSFMGLFWSVIHPLVLLISYTFVFSVIFQVRPSLKAIDNFALFAFCGMLPWLYFQDTVVRSCTSVIDQSHLIRKTLFPSEILPLVVALSNLVTHVIGFAILLVALISYGVLGWASLLIPAYLFLLLLLAVGLGWLVASLQVFLRDTAQVLSVLMVFWFWFTPIFYQVEHVPSPYRSAIQLNPLTYVVEGYRDLLLENVLPNPYSFLVLLLFSVAVFGLGGFVFRNTKREFVDVL
ncbi:MAG: ABC transporter permease [Acidobacteria bacterium]|nr:MAG: ABC transporter permease [Acidobacteriota bacterium]